jgi:hypothetical protein
MTPRTRKILDTLLLALLLVGVAQCGDRAKCDRLRDETYQKRRTWAQCMRDTDCFPMPGNPKDCTGVLSCPFAVNRIYREDAERLMLSIGEDSVDCHTCATPNCNTAEFPICEEVSHQCLVVERIVDGGSGGYQPPPEEPDVDTTPEGSTTEDGGSD